MDEDEMRKSPTRHKSKKKKKSKDLDREAPVAVEDHCPPDSTKKHKSKLKSNDRDAKRNVKTLKDKIITEEAGDKSPSFKKKKSKKEKKERDPVTATAEEQKTVTADKSSTLKGNSNKKTTNDDRTENEETLSSLGSAQRQEKFLRLLGGMKNKSKSDAPPPSSGLMGRYKATGMDRNKEEKLNAGLEKQYENAWDTTRKRRGLGLGYDAAMDPSVKKFHIDKEGSSSTKFT